MDYEKRLLELETRILRAEDLNSRLVNIVDLLADRVIELENELGHNDDDPMDVVFLQTPGREEN